MNAISIRFYRKNKDITTIIKSCVILVILAFVVINIKRFVDEYEFNRRVDEVRSFVLAERTVVHAGGWYPIGEDSYAYTNSFEALENCYKAGNRIAEIDFLMTSDGKLVCGHDSENEWCYGIESASPLTEEDFLKSKFMGKLTTMGLEQLAAFMRQHDDLFIVTDIKDNNYDGCKYIAKNYPDLIDRFIIQIYHITEYDSIKQLGFDSMIYTLYRTEPYEREREKLLDDLGSHNLVGVTFWYDWIETKDVYSNIKDLGIPLFVHTVNDRSDMERCKSMGLLVYTDNVSNEWFR